MKLKRISYKHLNGRQKEIYNFQKVAAILADYGFNCIKLSDDWQGADFLAYHLDGVTTLRVQLKSRLMICKKYLKKDLYIIFPCNGVWYLEKHDTLVALARKHTDWLAADSWKTKGAYSSGRPGKAMLNALVNAKLEND